MSKGSTGCGPSTCMSRLDRPRTHSQTAQGFLEEEGAEGASRFRTEEIPFGLRGEGTTGLSDVPVARRAQHKHRVDVCLVEHPCRGWHC
jgi:hypothetical protein